MPLSGIWIKYSVMFDVEKVRRDFPILGVRVYDKPLVYLDSGATAQKPECVIETVDRLHRESNANIHRGVHFLSEEATEMYEAARARIAEYIGAEAREEVVFTAGATASLNTVAYAWCERFLRAGDNIVGQRDGAPFQYRSLAACRRAQGCRNPRAAFRRGGAPDDRAPAGAARRSYPRGGGDAGFQYAGHAARSASGDRRGSPGRRGRWWWTDVRVSCTAVWM